MAPRKQTPKLMLTRSQPSTSTNGALRDDSDGDSEPASDEALAEFLGSPPTAADSLHVVAAGPSGDAIVQVRQRKEVLADTDAIAERITSACERWAQSERRLVRFRATWYRGERILATHAFEYGEANRDQPALDGSAQSFLIQNQHEQRELHKLYLEGYEMQQDSWKNLLALANRRNEALEKENELLRERLRKVDDIGNEIALETARAELEQRGRTTDLLEKRLLPIMQAVAVQKINESAALAGAGHKVEQGQHEKPSA